MSTISAKDVIVRYGHETILHGVDFLARAGEVTVVAGPNGSGKSTLVKAVSGEVASSGAIAINGRALGAYEGWQLAAQRGVLAQETTVAFPFTAAEIVGLGVTAGATRVARPAELIEMALDRVGLAGFGARRIQTLSGGERQRVQLARVLCQIWEPLSAEGPRWLIMDEPVASLDIRHQIGLMELARDYARAGGGVVAVMHDLNLSAMYGDHVVLMKSGRVAAAGAPEEVLRPDILSAVFACPLHPNRVPDRGVFVLPQSALAQPALALAAE
ncbi:heme ABC transporter ATP-binding protein [Rhizobium sp. C4]|uniref:heme ABC transporter ATP-binding protein n=1 Tax=Rhizobium sp. C4 TaxID=1349800 RepID=UPI001E4CF1C1|nr:heme ABC transporter ATP-binding protein [Rhizobium sp. C4]MCD2172090.1 heme ABC transporter ATP-binding protein [Rhizobium sp. C4]